MVDATNVQPEARRSLVALAKEHDVLPVAIVLDLPTGGVRRAQRGPTGPELRRRTWSSASMISCGGAARDWQREGFRTVHAPVRASPRSPTATITRTRLYNDRRDDHGPFDVIGDVHGCRAELETLLGRAGLRDHSR